VLVKSELFVENSPEAVFADHDQLLVQFVRVGEEELFAVHGDAHLHPS